MTDLVEYTLEDGTTVLFESAEADLVGMHGGHFSKEKGAAGRPPLGHRQDGTAGGCIDALESGGG